MKKVKIKNNKVKREKHKENITASPIASKVLRQFKKLQKQNLKSPNKEIRHQTPKISKNYYLLYLSNPPCQYASNEVSGIPVFLF